MFGVQRYSLCLEQLLLLVVLATTTVRRGQDMKQEQKTSKHNLKAIEQARAEVLEAERADLVSLIRRMGVYTGNTAVIRAYIKATV